MNNNQAAMERLFEGIYNFVAPAPDDGREQKSFYSQLRAGIDVSDFDEKESALMADAIPEVQRNYAAGAKVSDVYRKVLGAELPPDMPPAEKREAYEWARKITGKKSEGFLEYKEARVAYNKAYLNYCRLKNDSKSDPVDIQSARMEMNDAMTDFEASGKSEIEKALGIVSAYEKFTAQSVFNNAAEIFGQAETEKKATGYFAVDFIPKKWTGSSPLAWESLTLQTSSQVFKLDNESKKTEFSKSSNYSNGWWFWRREDNLNMTEKKNLEAANSKMSTNDLSLSMEVAIVEISRSWLDLSLLSYSEARIKNENPGAVCGGTLNGGGAMPLIPSAFVLVRNVNIYNQFSEEEKKMVKTVTDGSSDHLSFGPFYIRNQESTVFHDEISKSEQGKFGNVSCLSLGKAPQLIGVVSTVAAPRFPAH